MATIFYLLLPILLPLIAGLGSYFIPFASEQRRRLFYGVVICTTTVLAWAAILLCDGQTHVLLPFTDKLTLALRLDGAGKLFSALSSTLWPVTMFYGYDYMRHEERPALFWAFFTASFGVTLGIAWADNLMTMYLFYELLTLVTLPLVLHPMTKPAIRAGIQYVIYSISGAALAFIGLVFAIQNGADQFVPGGHLNAYGGNIQLLLTVFALAFIGFGVKAAIWPLQAWLPAAAVAPTPVTALLHAVAVVKAGAFACIRLTYYVFGTGSLQGTWAQQVVMALALITVLYGSCKSLKQRHFKLRLAYSTVSNLSYILFATALMSAEALTSSFLHLIVHSLVKILAFFTAGSVLHYGHRTYVAQLHGLGRLMPVTFGCFTVSAFALTGIPLFSGFVSKWRIILAAADNGTLLPLIGCIVLLLSALLTSIYMFQVAINAWFPSSKVALPPADSAHEAGPLMTVPMVVLAISCIVLGIFPQGLIDLIREAVML